MSIAPYLRPDLDQSSERPPLLITGSLANGKPGDAYEGRLQIHNQIGACSILSVTGDELPPGSSVYVDGDEIVVAWPAYVEAAAPITNPGFEDGMAGWQGGAGWSTTTSNPITGARSAVYYNAPGSSILSSQSRYPVNPGVPITATAAIRQGASSAGNAGAGVRLEFRDADGNLRRFKDGNMVMSASNNAVKPSSVTDMPQPGDALVNIACHGLRKRQNREVWADTFDWDHAVAAAGSNADATICITIQIRDSAGRTASWSGCVSIAGTLVALALGQTSAGVYRLQPSADGASFGAVIVPDVSVTSSSFVITATGRAVICGSTARWSDDYATWTIAPTPGYVADGNGIALAGSAILYPGENATYGILRSTDNAVSWSAVGAGVAWKIVGARPGLVIAITSTSQPAASLNDGATFGALGGRLDSTADAFNPGTRTGMADGNRVVFGGSAWQSGVGFVPALAYTEDNVTWEFRRCSLVSTGSVSSICVGSRGPRKVYLAGLFDGRIFQSDNDMATWAQVDTFGPGNEVARIVDNGAAFIAVGGSVAGIIRRSPDGDSGTWVTSAHALAQGVTDINLIP